MQVFIPNIGSRLVLNKDTVFNVGFERRNFSLIKHFLPKLMAEYEFLSQKTKYYGSVNKNQVLKIAKEEGWDIDVELNDPYYAIHCDYFEQKPDQNPPNVLDKIKHKFGFYAKQRELLEKNNNPIRLNLEKDTILEVDRIYIRKGAAQFSSVTFKIREKNKVLRFWVKLDQVNQIDCSLAQTVEKYPYGRFTLQIRRDYSNGLYWVANDKLPFGGIGHKGIGVEYHNQTKKIEDVGYQNNCFDKVYHFASFEDIIAKANKYNFSKKLIKYFTTKCAEKGLTLQQKPLKYG